MKAENEKPKNRQRTLFLSLGIIACIVIVGVIEILHVNQLLKIDPSIDFYDASNTLVLTVKRQPLSIKDTPSDVLSIVYESVEKPTSHLLSNLIYEKERDHWYTDLRKSFSSFYLNIFYDQDELTEIHLNELYFGNGIIGLNTASYYFFQKPIQQIDHLQLIYLLALEKGHQQSIDESNSSLESHMLQIMNELIGKKLLSNKLGQQYKEEIPHFLLSLNKTPKAYLHSYLESAIEEGAETLQINERSLPRKKMKIYLSLDQDIQKKIYHEFDQSENFPTREVQSSLVIMNHSTGEVKGLMTNRNPYATTLNRATFANRQPASTFKPLAVYAPALELGWDEKDILKDTPIRIGMYMPANHDYRFRGQVTLKEALVQSYNVPTIWLLQEIGLDKGISFLRRFNLFDITMMEDYPIGVGSMKKGVSPLQMTQAYSIFSNEGKMVTAHTIREATDQNGKILIDHLKVKKTDITTAEVANKIKDLMTAVVEEGTGKSAKMEGVTVSGKTGTASHDAWFIGVLDQYTVSVWMGTDSNQTELISGGSEPAVLFKNSMSQIVQ